MVVPERKENETVSVTSSTDTFEALPLPTARRK
jgi:hypothetical protein